MTIGDLAGFGLGAILTASSYWLEVIHGRRERLARRRIRARK